ncbi:MAG TPA: SDR family oxidoreductase [Novosphingobium sp.]|nr:SDR family oxidoreductase [Novosphingobium sp.]HQD99243.1 SDR family oxidoreductase [Novosphingobium sp.]
MSDHSGKVAVITGGARGFGRAFGEALAARGARVVLADLDSDEAALAAAAIGPLAEALALDVAEEAAVTAAMQDIAARHGGIDILINNAGIHSAEGAQPIGVMGLARSRQMFEVNVWGVIQCTLAAAPYMAGRAGAAIVNISSMASYPCTTTYGVTKLAVRGITTAFAHELGPQGIRVNAIAPGLIMTDTIRAELPEPVIAAVSSQQIVKREGATSDIVEAMLYLVSPASGFMTGECLRVSGGVTLQA